MTLRDLVIRQQVTGESDSELITEWIFLNSDVTEYIKMLSELAIKKIKHDEWVYRTLVDDLNLYGATTILISDFGLIDGYKLDSITRKYIVESKLEIDFEKCHPDYMEWLREFIPEHNQPFMFWNKFLDYLNSKGIYFKDQKNKNS